MKSNQLRHHETARQVLRRRLLLVEDEEESRQALREILETEGFEVAVANDGEAGVELARRLIPDLVLLDLALPVLNGFDAAARLKKDRLTAGIPLVAVTASWLGSEQRRLEGIGFDGALRKPFSAGALLDELARVFTLSAQPALV